MKTLYLSTIIALMVFIGYQSVNSMNHESGTTMKDEGKNTGELATFAGGCFWCTESDFEKIDGVIDVVSGYSGGTTETATYNQVSSGGTAHVEAVQVRYDPEKITYSELLDVFWRHVDPTDPGGQFVDRGAQYRTAIFYHDDDQRRVALASQKELDESGRFSKPIATEILAFSKFYEAEEYHQDYYTKSPTRYWGYRKGSGRDAYIKRIWGKE